MDAGLESLYTAMARGIDFPGKVKRIMDYIDFISHTSRRCKNLTYDFSLRLESRLYQTLTPYLCEFSGYYQKPDDVAYTNLHVIELILVGAIQKKSNSISIITDRI